MKTPKSTHSTENDTVVGGTVFMVFALNCGPCSLFRPTSPLQPAIPQRYRGQRPDDRGLLQVDPVSSGTGHRTQTALLVVKGDALDQTGDFLGRGLAFRECGGHRWEFILPRESAGGGVRKAIQGRFG
jgi:hypothetical protein